MDKKPDVIREQIEETRDSLTDKIEDLEEHVKESIHDVTHVMDHTADSVKSGLHERIVSVRRAFNLPHQVRARPWLTLSCAALAGAALGYVLTRPREGRSHPSTQPFETGSSSPPLPAETARVAESNGKHEPGVLTRAIDSFRPELEQVKEVALGLAVDLTRDLIKQALAPAVSGDGDQVKDRTTRKGPAERENVGRVPNL
jgi:ElaB/YqjD/DUF883 family membrane-anchored ribosome-binding protein